MRVSIIAFTLTCAAAATQAAPTATLTDLGWDVATKRLTATYSLDEDAIVTFDVKTNGVSIGETTLWFFSGDINRAVSAAGGAKTFVWDAGKCRPGLSVAAGKLEVEVTAWDRLTPPDYLVASVTVPSNVWYFASSNAVPGGVQDFRNKTEFLVMRRIPAKNVVWRMGTPADEPQHDDTWSCDKLSKVKLTHDYYIGVYQVTMQQSLSVGRGKGSAYNNERVKWMARPVGGMSYEAIRGKSAGAGWPNDDPEIAHAVDEYSAIDKWRKRTGLKLDLPTEAQWEYACRAGTSTGFYDGTQAQSSSESSNFNRLGRYRGNGGTNDDGFVDPDIGGTAIVGSYLPNAWGLYDMLGNMREWCLDYWRNQTADDLVTVRVDPVGVTAAESQDAVDGKGGAHPGNRCCRGGAYYDAAYQVRSGHRAYASPSTNWSTQGYRLCLTIE